MQFTWKQKLGNPDSPYLYRWVADFNLFSIRLHHWICGDDPRHFHDHPWNFIVFVLKGSYFDVSKNNREEMKRWTVKYRHALHSHTVETKGCWTLVLTGPTIRKWGFYIQKASGKTIWIRARRYFFRFKTHQCN
jgi:hypothetical protein